MTRPFILTALCTLLVAAAPASAQESAEQVLAQFEGEPTVLEVQQVALAYAGIDQQMLEGWYNRANVAKLAPDQARFRVIYRDREYDDRYFTEDLNADSQLLGAEDRRIVRGQDATEYQGEVRWNFSELIFNPDVLRVSNEVNRQVKLRENILSAATKIYYERRRAQVELVLSPPTDTGERLRKELRVQELTAELDGMTGGWFSEQLRALGRDPY